jgi:hypothetical protein
MPTSPTLPADLAARALRLRARVDAGGLARRHAKLARRAGIDGIYLILSFDCDTDDDARVAWQVHERLAGIGVRPVYAVPGELLRRGADVYGRIAQTGAEFLNHGGREHTFFDEELGRHASNFFYDQQTPERVRQDVEEGHAHVADVIGVEPRGWRTPHFGTYQEPGQLRYLHGVLADLGYAFSTSTTPRFGLRHGPLFDSFGLPELPVTGTPRAPHEILDTWAFFAAPDRVHTPADYLEQARLLADLTAGAGAGLINVYGDPVHVHERDEFFDAIEALAGVATPISYGELLERVR